jgi:NAD-dependent histone deacetylase SIR2
VLLELKPIAAVQTQGILTPMDSPRQQSPVPPNGKLKQAALSFTSSKFTIPPATDIKVPKKRGRKPLPDKPTKPSNKITNAFTTSKVSTESSKSAKSKNSAEESGSNLFPNLYTESTPMRPISPFETRSNSDPSSYKDPETPKQKLAVEIPSYNRHETISPKGRLPSGMANLLS